MPLTDKTSAAEPLSLAVYGLFDIECGLKVAAENTLRVLEARGQGLRLESIQPDGSLVTRGASHRPQVNLFHANPDWLLRMLDRTDSGTLAVRQRLNACVPFWELPELPTAWLSLLSSMDILLAPTGFIAEAIKTSLPDACVIPLPQAVFLPEGIGPDRAHFGIPSDAFSVAMSFAVSSGVDRKNPWASVEAFLGAFPSDSDVRLVVRVNEQAGPEPGDMISRLREESQRDARLILLTGTMDYRETLTMYASCDAYLSMHRSEGLGLGPMEAMSLGLPVVATGWSGNMDFMTADNSLPVPYRLVPVEVADTSPYARGVVAGNPQWAEPDVGVASGMLRMLHEDVALRSTIGANAALSMEKRRVEVLEGDFIVSLRDAFDEIQGPGGLWRSNHPKGDQLDALHKVRRRAVQGQGLCARASRMLRRG